MRTAIKGLTEFFFPLNSLLSLSVYEIATARASAASGIGGKLGPTGSVDGSRHVRSS